ncbi:hypothetical protein OPV22_022825 [Ensete ventricosum]|uniref:Peptidase S8/S53 domain-containing protein n=1 Tax=Ensete ventricosum TaxID=4639 RepID=A0AAV8QVE0_ENSVE|nr:hypothetical protein OPV22_022825 [Ensete ventricosum]
MDGVDIISISINSDHASEYFEEPIVIGACYTMKKGILTSACGGNDRCSCRGMVDNVATLMLVSYVNSIDLRFINTLGASINTFPTEKKFYPFIYFDDETFPSRDSTQLDKGMVRGKIVFSGPPSDGLGPLFVGAKGISSLMHTSKTVGSCFSSSAEFSHFLISVIVTWLDAKLSRDRQSFTSVLGTSNRRLRPKASEYKTKCGRYGRRLIP